MLLASIRCSSIALGYTFNSTRALANNSHLVSLFLVPFLILLKKKKKNCLRCRARKRNVPFNQEFK